VRPGVKESKSSGWKLDDVQGTECGYGYLGTRFHSFFCALVTLYAVSGGLW
jgi:hypothetical protein